MKNKRGMIPLVLMPLASIFIALAVAECALRVFAPFYTAGIQSAYQYDPELGYRLVPGIHRYELTDHLEEIRTNAIGTVNFQEHFDRYSLLVFAAGDSYTQGTGNSSDSSYPFQLDLLLNQDERGRYQERYGIVNLGLAAFGTEQSLIALKRYAQLLGKPKYILYLGCDNDWEDDVLLRAGYRHREIVAGSPTWGRLVGPMLWLSRLQVVARVKFALSEIRRAHLVRQAGPGPNKAGGPSTAERVWPTIEHVAALSRDWNAVLVLGWADPGSESYAWLKARAEQEHIPFADWGAAVESVRASMPDLPIANSHSSGHWRPWVNGVIARSYALEMGVWPTPAGEATPSATRPGQPHE